MCKINDLEIYCNEILKDAEIQEKNQIKIIKELEGFNRNFDEEIENALKKSIFEFKITHILLIDKETINYIREKNNCPNKVEKIVFHGTKIDSAIAILSDQFRDSKAHAIGIGVYFTDSLDYAWNYSKDHPLGSIPKVNDYFSFVASEIYYNENLLETVYDYRTFNDPAIKFGVRCCYGKFKGPKLTQDEIELYKNKRAIAKEFLITDKCQILPLYSITVKRLEYLVIWRDYNFDIRNPNNYAIQTFNEMKEFHRKIKKIISREFDSKIYYIKTTEEALELIDRKQYNKIIIITNGANNAIDFIRNARKIIGAKVIVGVSVYNIPLHISWIKTMKNTLLLNDIDFHYKFFKAIMQNNEMALYNLKNEIINYYTPKFAGFNLGEFDSELLRFPKFKREGSYLDLTFNQQEKCQIF